MVESIRQGRLVATERAATYAEGIACRVPVPEALDMLLGRVDDLLLVSEDELHAAEAELRAASGITAEGAAAASWSGLLQDRERTRRGPAGGNDTAADLVILTGSNAAT
jgi:threonine dehydratase